MAQLTCEKCPGKLGRSHVASANESTITRRAECPLCHTAYVTIEFRSHEIQKGKGTGAHAVAKEIAEGRRRALLTEASSDDTALDGE